MGLFDFFKTKKAKMNNDDVLIFDKLDKQIKKYNRMRDRRMRDRISKGEFFWKLYDQIVELENNGKIAREPGKKPISYLKELGYNDGPEYLYIIKFWPIWDKNRKYEISLCVRAEFPIIKKLN